MIFLVVVDLPRVVPDACEACHELAAAVLFTCGPAHLIGGADSGRDGPRDHYHGGPDVFLLCREHAAAARAMIDAQALESAHAQRCGSVQASWGRIQRTRGRGF